MNRVCVLVTLSKNKKLFNSLLFSPSSLNVKRHKQMSTTYTGVQMTMQIVTESDSEHESDTKMKDVTHSVNINKNNANNAHSKSESDFVSDSDVADTEPEQRKQIIRVCEELKSEVWPEMAVGIADELPSHMVTNRPMVPKRFLMIDTECNWPSYVFLFCTFQHIQNNKTYKMHTAPSQMIKVDGLEDDVMLDIKDGRWPLHWVSSKVIDEDLDVWQEEVSPYRVELGVLYAVKKNEIFEAFWKGFGTPNANKIVVSALEGHQRRFINEPMDYEQMGKWMRKGYWAWFCENCLIHQCQLYPAEIGVSGFQPPMRRIGERRRCYPAPSNRHNHNHK